MSLPPAPQVEPVETEPVKTTALSPEERSRYARNISLAALGEGGQQRLRNARVCVVGAGGLGSPILLYLTGAGVGSLTLVDDDLVDATNLQRQVIHSTAAVGIPKVDSAAARVRALDPGVRVIPLRLRLDANNAPGILAGHDVVVDATDNIATRYVVSDACAALCVPSVWGALAGASAQVSVFRGTPDGGGLTLRDLFPDPPESAPTASEVGALGAACGITGSVMAAEVVKLVAGVGEPLYGRVLFVDAWAGTFAEIPLTPRSTRG